MVTKQEQLEWMSKALKEWPFILDDILMSNELIGIVSYAVGSHRITKQEWQQERDKVSSKSEVDNSWHERGEFPPAGCECEVFVSDEMKWMHFEVIAIRDGHVLGWCREGSCGFQSNDKYDFRPLRTEREKAIDEMLLAIDHIKEGNFETFIGALYDAGYRKVKP